MYTITILVDCEKMQDAAAFLEDVMDLAEEKGTFIETSVVANELSTQQKLDTITALSREVLESLDSDINKLSKTVDALYKEPKKKVSDD